MCPPSQQWFLRSIRMRSLILYWLKIRVASLIFLRQCWLRPAEELSSPSIPGTFWVMLSLKRNSTSIYKAFFNCLCFCVKEQLVRSDLTATFEPLELYFCSHRSSMCWVFLTKHSPTVLSQMVQYDSCTCKPKSEIVQVCCSSQGKCQ